MYERSTIYRKNLMPFFNSGSFPNLGKGGDYLSGAQGYGPVGAQNTPYFQGPYATPQVYGPQGYPPQGYPQAGFGPVPYGPAGGYGYGINPIGAGLIGLGLGFLGGQLVNTPFKGPHKRYYYYW
ncbi:hypothetical protein LCD52_04850 [Rossellomorea vietnamensis]|uniref:hypothetical protein n=1 Tax=Rossellomorea vietnamensis TaxID=218284 RepID=UPI001CCD6392|nr:hypothetical protein [Rossellomorea vietnamensis]MCA0148120.1 hypothetical protein [Rossellomorea vietnamensis]